MTAAARPAPRTITLGRTTYPVFLPSIRDPRLHVASVIITIHVLGQVGLHFRVSVPQILAAILTTALIEIALTFRSSKAFVWPASAMLTGSGVALILRVVGTPPDQPWNTDGMWIFAGVAAFSLLTKYVIKYRGSHLFNPSNVGLVVAFLVLGMGVVEPLDFWWGPLSIWLVVAYAVILIGGTLITRRLHLIGLAAAFWLTFAAGLGLLAGSGHCMTANWAFAPVCGVDFWRVIVTSPELMIFLFFMITDPKTVPGGNVARVAFGVIVAIACTLLIAPQTDEWGTKVALLSGLVLVCLTRPVLDRLFPEPRSTADDVRRWARGATAGLGRVAVAAVVVVAIGTGVVLAGIPARGFVSPVSAADLGSVPYEVDPSTFPAITVEQDVADWSHEIAAGEGARAVLLTLAENLELENQALLRDDPSILAAVDHGDRLTEMQARLAEANASGRIPVRRYHFDEANLVLIIPFGVQSGLSLGVEASGTITTETVDRGGTVLDRSQAPFRRTFAMRQVTGERWLTVGDLAETPSP
jgi:Na+-translocating ferredoxin:NAD+ oxidoreductase RnfD subunit